MKNYLNTEISGGRVSLLFFTSESKKVKDSPTAVTLGAPQYFYSWLQAPGHTVLSQKKTTHSVAFQSTQYLAYFSYVPY